MSDHDEPRTLHTMISDWAARGEASWSPLDADERRDQHREPPPRHDPEDAWARIAPKRFRDAQLSDIDDVPAAESIYVWRDDPTRNLLVLGDIGTGKTHAALALGRWALEQGHTVVFWPLVELLNALRPHADDAERTYEFACKRDVLILDDLGGNKPSDWADEQLYALVNRRWLEARPIIATSNLPASNGSGPLVEAIGRRVYDRLVQDAVTVRVGGESRRRQ